MVFWEDQQDRQIFSQTNKRQRDTTQINKIRNENNDNRTKEIIRFYFKNLYSLKLENLNEMDDFQGKCNLQKLKLNVKLTV